MIVVNGRRSASIYSTIVWTAPLLLLFKRKYVTFRIGFFFWTNIVVDVLIQSHSVLYSIVWCSLILINFIVFNGFFSPWNMFFFGSASDPVANLTIDHVLRVLYVIHLIDDLHFTNEHLSFCAMRHVTSGSVC